MPLVDPSRLSTEPVRAGSVSSIMLKGEPGFEGRFLETDDGKVFVQAAGSGSPVLLLHGFPDTSLMWRDVAPRLAARFRRSSRPAQLRAQPLFRRREESSRDGEIATFPLATACDNVAAVEKAVHDQQGKNCAAPMGLGLL